MPKPLRMPFTAIVPKGTASNRAGGRPDSGPVMAGVGSAAGAGGAGGAGVWSAGFCPSTCGGAAFCAPQTEARVSANTAIFVHICSRIILLRRFGIPETVSNDSESLHDGLHAPTSFQ